MTSQWPDNCDAITWIVISNSLDIDFIHGDIHGRSCKKKYIHVLWLGDVTNALEFVITTLTPSIESVETTSFKNESTRVLEENESTIPEEK